MPEAIVVARGEEGQGNHHPLHEKATDDEKTDNKAYCLFNFNFFLHFRVQLQ